MVGGEPGSLTLDVAGLQAHGRYDARGCSYPLESLVALTLPCSTRALR